MDLEELKNKIKELATNAVKFDKLEEYQKAFDLYKQVANDINILIKNDKNLNNKEEYIKKAKSYILKAKEIKEKILNKKEKKDEIEDNEEEIISKIINKEIPKVKLEDVIGLEKAKEILKEAIIYPYKFPNLYQGKQKPWKSILLYGPPGTGKSLLAKAVANEFQGNFFYVSAANIVSKYFGKSEYILKKLFDLARKKKPSVIFMDEIDSIMSERSENESDSTRNIKSLIISEIGNILNEEGILFLCNSNIPWLLDHVLIAKIQKKIYILYPDFDARKKMIKYSLNDTPNTLTEEQYDDLASKTGNNYNPFSGSGIFSICQDAIFEPVRKCQRAEYFKKIPGINGFEWNYTPCDENEPGAIKMKMTELPDTKALLPPKVEYQDFIDVLKRIRGCYFSDPLKKYEEFKEKFGDEN